MQSEAFRYEKSFEHSPKPSKYLNYTVFNDSNAEKYKKRKNVENQFRPVLQYVKNMLNSMVQSVLAETF